METRCAQSLCFNFDELFAPGNQYKLYIMEIDLFLDDDGAAEDIGEAVVMVISFVVIVAVQPRSGHTLRLMVSWSPLVARIVVALLDYIWLHT